MWPLCWGGSEFSLDSQMTLCNRREQPGIQLLRPCRWVTLGTQQKAARGVARCNWYVSRNIRLRIELGKKLPLPTPRTIARRGKVTFLGFCIADIFIHIHASTLLLTLRVFCLLLNYQAVSCHYCPEHPQVTVFSLGLYISTWLQQVTLHSN